MNQRVTFLSDGDEKLRDQMFGLNPNTEYLLDWFHITFFWEMGDHKTGVLKVNHPKVLEKSQMPVRCNALCAGYWGRGENDLSREWLLAIA